MKKKKKHAVTDSVKLKYKYGRNDDISKTVVSDYSNCTITKLHSMARETEILMTC